mgnify:CR=1 FL=1
MLNRDIPLIRDAISERFGGFFFCIAGVIAGYCISFSVAWKVALVTLAGTLALIIPTALIGKAITIYSAKGQSVYAEAGAIAQEVVFFFQNIFILFKTKKSVNL